MNKLIYMFLAIMLAGCARHPYRTGTVAVQKFDATAFETNNPFQVKQDAVDNINNRLYKSLGYYISRDTKMKTAVDCSTADYLLSGKITEVNTELDSHFRLVTITVEQKYKIYATAELKDCKTQKVIKTMRHDKEKSSVDSVVSNLAEYFANNIKKDESIILDQ